MSAVLITDEYRRMQQQLHENPHYGSASVHFAPLVAQIIEALKVTEVLDYGAGKARLAAELPKYISGSLTMHHYDPAIPQWSASPAPREFVACIDVLEHIEPDLLDNVLDDLKRVTAKAAFFTVHVQPAGKVLPDGRNAHLIQKPAEWWLPKILERFELVTFSRMPQGFWVGLETKPRAS